MQFQAYAFPWLIHNSQEICLFLETNGKVHRKFPTFWSLKVKVTLTQPLSTTSYHFEPLIPSAFDHHPITQIRKVSEIFSKKKRKKASEHIL